MTELDLFVRKVSAHDYGVGGERESELRRLLASALRATTPTPARALAAALNGVLKQAAAPPPAPQQAAQLFAVCFAAVAALDQLRPVLNAAALAAGKRAAAAVSAADVAKLHFNLAVHAITARQFAAAERFVDAQMTAFRSTRTSVGAELSAAEFAALAAAMYQHASLRSVNKRLPTDDAARALAFLFAADALVDSALADARRLVRAAGAAGADDAALAVRAVLSAIPTRVGKQLPSRIGAANDENAFLPAADESPLARAFVCRLFVQKATCVAQAPTKNRLCSVLVDGAAWFASLASATPPFAAATPTVAATFVYALADVAAKHCAADDKLVAQCAAVAAAALAATRDAPPAALALFRLAQQRLAPRADWQLATLGTSSQFEAVADGEFLFEFVLGLEALRADVVAKAASRADAAAISDLIDAAVARGAALEKAAGTADGRFSRLALKRAPARAAAADHSKVLQSAVAAADALVKQPKAACAEALAALQSARAAVCVADGDVRAQAKVGSAAFNAGIAMYNAARFDESCQLLEIAAAALHTALRALQAAQVPTLPFAQTSKAFFMLAHACRCAKRDADAVEALKQALQLHPLLCARADDADDDALAELRPLVELYCELEQDAPLHEFAEFGDAQPVSVVAALLELQLAASASVPSCAGDVRIRLFEALIDVLGDGSALWCARQLTVRGRLAAALHELGEGEPLVVLDAALDDARQLPRGDAAPSGTEQAVAQLHAWRALLASDVDGALDVDSLRLALDANAGALASGRGVAALAPTCAELFDSLAEMCGAAFARGDLELECRAASVRCWECAAAYDWPSARAPSAVAHVQWATALAARGCRTAATAMFARVEAFLEAGDDESDDAVDDAADLAECAAFARLRAAVLTQPTHAHAAVCTAAVPGFATAASAASYDAERLLALAGAERTCVHAAEAGATSLAVEASLVPMARARAAFDSARRAHARVAQRAPNSLAWNERTSSLMQFEALLALGRGYECCAAVDEAVSCYAKAAKLAEQLQYAGHLAERAHFFGARVRALACSSAAAAAADAVPTIDSGAVVAAGVRGLETLLLAVDQLCAVSLWDAARGSLAQFDACAQALVVQNAQVLRSLDAPDADARAAADFGAWAAAGDARRAILAGGGSHCAPLAHECHGGPLSCRDLALVNASGASMPTALALCGRVGDSLLLPRVATAAAVTSVKLGERRGLEHVPAMLQHLAIGGSIRHRALLALADDSAKLAASSGSGGSSSSDDVGSLNDLFEDMTLEPTAAATRSTDALRQMCSFASDAALVVDALGAKVPAAVSVKLQAWLAPIAAAQRAHRWALVSVSVTAPAAPGASPAVLISRREPSGKMMYVVRRDADVGRFAAAFEALLEDSSASMKATECEPADETASAGGRKRGARSAGEQLSREEKSEWWKTRRELDERLQALMGSVESELFGPWICLLEGASTAGAVDGDTALLEKAAKQLGVDDDDAAEHLMQRLVDAGTPLTGEAMRSALRDVAPAASDANVDKVAKLLLKRAQAAPGGERHAVVLVLDELLQQLPLESMPALRSTSISRLPSMALGRMLCERVARDEQRACDADRLFYVLNPAGDLANTQKRFEAFVVENGAWNGHIGNAPSEAAFLDALRKRDVVVYMGHNCAERIAAPPAVAKLAGGANAVAWLLGCSSARLERRGAFGVHGSALAYLIAGCPAFVGCLWDVTDGDCDKFSMAALNAWLGGGGVTLATAVRLARDKCLMRSLVGAAPVVYGLPHWTCGKAAAAPEPAKKAAKKRSS